MEFSLPRGLRDISPEEADSFEIIRAAFVETCRIFDYKLMEPSSLELLETLEAKSGPAIRDEIDLFQRQERSIESGLRFDLTVGITRFVASKRELSPPVRDRLICLGMEVRRAAIWKIQMVLPVGRRNFRPFKCRGGRRSDRIFISPIQKLGTNPRISIGSRKILESFIRNSLGIDREESILDAMRAVDKLAKKSFDQIVDEYSKSFSKDQFQKLVDFVKLAGEASNVSEALRDFHIDASSLLVITDSLASRRIRDVELNLSIVRGIDYYTDMVFEAFDRDNPRLGALCGGGRYDSLPSVYRPVLILRRPALLVAWKEAMLVYKLKKSPLDRVFVASIGTIRKLRAAATADRSRIEIERTFSPI